MVRDGPSRGTFDQCLQRRDQRHAHCRGTRQRDDQSNGFGHQPAIRERHAAPDDQRRRLAITTAALTSGTAGQAYTMTMAATGGIPPYTWSATGLPSGLSINASTGVISGTPSSASSGNVTIKVTDSTTPTALTASTTLPLTINSAGLTITTTSLSAGTVGQSYSATLAATGGVPPYSWSVFGMPSGLSLNPATGAITGTPTG